jgi:membrane protease YdiL (CAAX protease family)
MQIAQPLAVAASVTAAVALLSYVLPSDYQSTGVGLCLILATYLLVIRRDSASIRHHGLALAGIFEPEPIRPRRLWRAALRSLLWSTITALLFFPLFWAGFVLWWTPPSFDWPEPPLLGFVLTQIVGIAVPEEMFYRGYVQTAIDDATEWRAQLFGTTIGPGIVIASIIFALGHLATAAHPARLAVFFPSLVFGWLRARTGGIGAAVCFHAACNVFSAYLTEAYFPQ